MFKQIETRRFAESEWSLRKPIAVPMRALRQTDGDSTSPFAAVRSNSVLALS